MSEIKKLYVIDWVGPFRSLDEADRISKAGVGSFYIVTGQLAPNCKEKGIKYIGISGRDPRVRMREKDDIAKMSKIFCKEYWIGRFSVSDYNEFGQAPDPKRKKAELIENLLVRYIALLRGADSIINKKKTYCDPIEPVVIISRGEMKDSDYLRCNKPAALKDLPDVLMYVDGDFYASDKLQYRFESE